METESERRHHVSLAKATLLHLSQARLAPTPENYAAAWQEMARQMSPPPAPALRPGRRFPDGIIESYEDGELASARRLAEGRQRLIVSLTSLLETICEVAPGLVGEDIWVARQFDCIRRAISHSPEQVDRGELEQVRQTVKSSLKEHGELLSVRRDALAELKRLLTQWVANLSGLMDSSLSYSESLDGFLSRIEGVDDIETLTSVLGDIVDRTGLMRSDLARTRQAFEETCRRADELERCVNELSSELSETTALAVTDELTSLLNRRGLDIAFDELQLEARRRHTSFAVALLDLDHFKQINDAQGHRAGDDALRYFAAAIRGQLRPSDRCCRFGGDEFVLLLPGVGLHQAVEILRRLQRVVVERTLVYGSGDINLSFSAGVAQAAPGMVLDEVLRQADDALYEAKLAGRNRVCPFEGRRLQKPMMANSA